MGPPDAFFQAALGRGIIPVFMEGRASLALTAFPVRVRCSSPAPAGVRDRGGRGRKAAPSLRVRHLALRYSTHMLCFHLRYLTV
ncbi:hypothetical protein NDU88_007509 [Pleurodeles waltl]|uniref:Uncharacterized protein n=1 Tax=Pleurodeles waltl TaxID=8319 RepID=A0AAV7P117_PLEWA|nr:hypothetical protein NDU88_007509 [Pleurodeles waltl]